MKKIATFIIALNITSAYAGVSKTYSDSQVKNKYITKFSTGSIDQSSFFCIKYDDDIPACSVRNKGHYGYAYNELFNIAKNAYLFQLPVDIHIESGVFTSKELAENFGTANVNTDEIRAITF